MQIIVKDGLGANQTIVVNGVAELTDRSGSIAEADVAQELMAANDERGGWFLQNLGTVPVLVKEIEDGEDPEMGWYTVLPLGIWPPANYPLTLAAIRVKSSEVDAEFCAREW